MKSKFIKSVVFVSALLMLTGCSNPDIKASSQATGGTAGSFSEQQIHLTDGRTVTCVVWKFMNAGGLSCDWRGL